MTKFNRIAKNWLIGVSVAAVCLAIACACGITAQQKAVDKVSDGGKTIVIREVKNSELKVAPASAECLQTFREFFNYVQQPKPDIADDKNAQQKWLAQDLREAVAGKVESVKQKLAKNPTDESDFPDNGTFVGTWDYPSTYAIVDSRQYAERTVIDVLYVWGERTNYEGSKRLSSFIFVKENGTWKLEDIYSFREEFNRTESLIQYLRQR